jgi:hypothetical protein
MDELTNEAYAELKNAMYGYYSIEVPQKISAENLVA